MLVTVAEVLAAMGIPLKHEGQMAEAVTSAINRATARASGFLGTALELQQTTDKFYIDLDLIGGVTYGGLVRLRLSHGYLKSSPAAQVATHAKPFDAPESQDLGSVMLNLKEGVLLVNPEWDKQYVTVTYQHGFTQNGDIDPVVKEAILSMVPRFLQLGTSTEDTPPKGTNGDDIKLALELLSKSQRLFPNSMLPVYTFSAAAGG